MLVLPVRGTLEIEICVVTGLVGMYRKRYVNCGSIANTHFRWVW